MREATAPLPYWARYTEAAAGLPARTSDGAAGPGVAEAWGMFGKRLMENFGIRDIWDEVARLNDDEGLVGILQNLFGWDSPDRARDSVLNNLLNPSMKGQVWNAIPQALTSGAIEGNRLLGATALALGGGRDPREGFQTPDTWSLDPLRNYLTGGLSWEEQEAALAQSAPGVYKAATFGDLMVLNYDRMIKAGLPEWAARMNTLNIVGAEAEGPLANGSYLSAAWDITAPDAGQQLRDSGLYRSQVASANLATELIVDPLNWAAAPLTGVWQATKGYRIIAEAADAGSAASRANVIGAGADLTGLLELDKVQKRALSRPAGLGLWNQGRMLQALGSQQYDKMMGFLASETNPERLAQFFHRSGMVANSDDAYALGRVASRLDNTEDVLHLFNAATVRNVHSIRRINDVLTDSTVLVDRLNADLGLAPDMFSRALLDFPEGGVVPKGHILADSARQFIDELVEADPTVKQAWDALADPAAKDLIKAADDQRQSMHAMQRLFGTQPAADAVTGVRPVGAGDVQGMRTIEFVPRARRAEKWMKGPRTRMFEGTRLSRYNPRILLMDKPGLLFSLHGDDAVDKFNDMIAWVDARITSNRYLSDYSGRRFTPEADKELRDLRDEFLEAGIVSGKPEESRAKIVDRFQMLVLRRMAEATGIAPEVASVIAARGMDKGRELADALTDAERGYATAVLEDGRPTILAGQPSVERQAANYVPLMDWDGAFKAMWAIRRGENAIGRFSPDDIISEAHAVEEYLGATGRYANKPLKYVGRERTVLGRGTHLMVDVADAVNHIFKMAVLLRLGYTTRNLAEGLASTMASGMSTLEMMKYVDLGGLVGNSLNNLYQMPSRLIDRVKVATGRVLNDEALIQMGDAHGAVKEAVEDRLHSLMAVASDPGALDEAVAVINDPAKYSAEERTKAAEGLRWMITMRQRLALGVTRDNIATARPFRSHSSAHAAQHLYHADTGGSMAAASKFDSEGVLSLDQPIDRPIRLVEDPTMAHGHVSAQWPLVNARGSNATQRATALQANARKAGGGTMYRYTDRKGVQKQTTKPSQVLAEANPNMPVTIHRVNRNGTVYANGRPVPLPPPTIASQLRANGITMKTHHLQMRDGPNGLWQPYSPKRLTATSEVRYLDRATHPDGFPKVVSVDTWGSEVDLRDTAGVRDLTGRFTDVDDATVRAAQAGDHAAQDRLSEVLASHGIYRMVLPDRRAAGWGRYQVVVHPKGVGEQGLKDAVNAEFEELVRRGVSARGTSEAELGVTVSRRTGEATGIGYLSRKQVRDLNKRARKRSVKQKHHMLGQPMVANSRLGTVEVLRNGGFEQMADELVEASIRARRDLYTVQALYGKRRAASIKRAKRTGIRVGANRISIASAYGSDHSAPSMLDASDGGMYRSMASGEASYMMGFTQLGYLTDTQFDLARGYLQPKTVAPGDPRYFDALANMFGRQYRDAPGLAAGGAENLDPMVRRLMQPGDRERILSESIDWALNTEEGRQWVRTLGLRVEPGRAVEAELAAARKAAKRRAPKPKVDKKGRPVDLTRAEKREPINAEWRTVSFPDGDIAVSEVNVGDVVSTMANFLDNYVLPSRRATQELLRGNITGDSLRAAYVAEPWTLRPVHGMLSPTTWEARNALRARADAQSGMQNLNEWIIRKMSGALRTIGPVPETRMLRHPVFEMVGQQDLQQRIRYAEVSLGRRVTFDEFNQMKAQSQRFALRKMEQTLYTLKGRSTVDDYLRFVAPFFPAWKNALTRWGRSVNETPGHVAKFASRVQTVGRRLTIVDENGEEVGFDQAPIEDSYIIAPGLGGILERITGIEGAREAMRNTYIPLRSTDVIFQGEMLSPGSGPFVAVPLQWWLTGHSEWLENDVVKWVSEKAFPVGPTNTGRAGMDVAQLFMPSVVRRGIDRLHGADLDFLPAPIRDTVKDLTETRAWAGEYDRNIRLLLVAQQEGEVEPMSTSELFEKAKELTRLKMNVKMISAFASPVANQQRGDAEFYASVWRSLRDAYGSTEAADDAFEDLFPTKHLLTSTSSLNQTGGAATSRAAANQRSYTALQQVSAELDTTDLLGFVENYDDDAFLTGEESVGYTQEDYNPFARRYQTLNSPEGSNEPFRSSRTPEQSMRNAIVKEGWRMFDQTEATIERSLVQEGLAVGSYAFEKEKERRLAIASDHIGRDYPEWADERGKRDEERLNRNELWFKQVISNPELGFITPERSQHALIQSIERYFAVRDSIRNLLYQQKMADPSASVSTSAQGNAHLGAILAREQAMLSAGSPAFRDWVRRYFRNDVVSIDNVDLVTGRAS